jgi:hypothetical protein
MKPIHMLVGCDRDGVSEATGWNAYLEQETGVRGDDSLTHPASRRSTGVVLGQPTLVRALQKHPAHRGGQPVRHPLSK